MFRRTRTVVRMGMKIDIKGLARFETGEDGASISLVAEDVSGRSVRLTFPIDILSRPHHDAAADVDGRDSTSPQRSERTARLSAGRIQNRTQHRSFDADTHPQDPGWFHGLFCRE